MIMVFMNSIVMVIFVFLFMMVIFLFLFMMMLISFLANLLIKNYICKVISFFHLELAIVVTIRMIWLALNFSIYPLPITILKLSFEPTVMECKVPGWVFPRS
jgi:hypothetical protein